MLDCLPPELREGLFPVGRLDKNTEGLLLLTDDGQLNRRLLDPDHHVKKRYRFWAAGELDEAHLTQLREGILVKGIANPLRPAEIQILCTASLGEISAPVFENRLQMVREQPETPAFYAEICLTEGKRHQIKRMMEAMGCTVVSLQRIAFGDVVLDTALPVGSFRPLTVDEIAVLLSQ